MILLLDCGNTLAKFAWLSNNERTPAKALEYKDLNDLASHIKHQPSQIFGTYVTSQTNKDKLEKACLNTWNINISWCDANHGRELLHSNYANSLGADRWLAALGLWHQIKDEPSWLAGEPYILVSFGTATTIDTIHLKTTADNTKRACFLGGLILPGAEMMRSSLATGTASLPLAHGKPADFPLDTLTAINSGVIAAQSGAILRQWQKARLLMPGSHPRIFVCGGAWPTIANDIIAELSYVHNIMGLPEQAGKWLDNPVLDGLALLASQS